MLTLRWPLWILLLLIVLVPRYEVGADTEGLAAAARHYRMQVYASFRTDRPQLDRRLQAAQVLLQSWQDRGAPEQEIPGLLRWFRQATRASQLARYGPLPRYAAVDQRRSPDAPARGTGGAAEDLPASSLNNASEAEDPAPLAADARPAVNNQPGNPRSRSGRNPRQLPDNLPPMASGDLLPLRPIPSQLEPPERFPAIRLRPSESEARSVDPRPMSAAPPTSVNRHAGPTHLPREEHATEVNLDLLDAKIRSLNLSLLAVESELVEQPEWSVEQLEDVVTSLSRLIDAAALVQIYYEAISYEQRELIQPLVDTGPIRALLAQRAFETRIRLTEAVRNKELEAVDDRLNRLETIAEVMQRWTRDH